MQTCAPDDDVRVISNLLPMLNIPRLIHPMILRGWEEGIAVSAHLINTLFLSFPWSRDSVRHMSIVMLSKRVRVGCEINLLTLSESCTFSSVRDRLESMCLVETRSWSASTTSDAKRWMNRPIHFRLVFFFLATPFCERDLCVETISSNLYVHFFRNYRALFSVFAISVLDSTLSQVAFKRAKMSTCSIHQTTSDHAQSSTNTSLGKENGLFSFCTARENWQTSAEFEWEEVESAVSFGHRQRESTWNGESQTKKWLSQWKMERGARYGVSLCASEGVL